MFKVCRHFSDFVKFFEDYNRQRVNLKFYKNPTCSEHYPGLADASLVTVPHLYQVNGKTVPPGESQVMNDKDWGYV